MVGGLENRRLSYQQPIQSKQKEIFVYSTTELKNTIGQLIVENQNFPGLKNGFLPGKIIKIGKSFTLTESITIPAEAAGLTIDGCYTDLFPFINQTTAFVCYASLCTLKNISLGGNSGNYFQKLVRFNAFADQCKVIYNRIRGIQLVDSGASSMNDILIEGNICIGAGTGTWCYLQNANRGRIIGNKFDPGVGVQLVSGCQEFSILGNSFNSATLDTSGSNGGNIIMGNTDMGAQVLHALDVSYPNAPLGTFTAGFVLTSNGPGTVPTWQAAGAGSVNITQVEVDLGSIARKSGSFTITDAAIGATNQLIVTQAADLYTGKGTRSDEAEMDAIVCSAICAAGSATVYWNCSSYVQGNVKFNYLIG